MGEKTAVLRRDSYPVVVAILLLLGVSRGAQACAICVQAMAERAFPPANTWAILVAFFITGLAVFWPRESGSLTRIMALVGVLAAILLGLAAMGPIPLLLLGVIAAFDLARRIRTKRMTRSLAIYTGFAAFVFAGSCLYEYHRLGGMSDVEYVLRWEGTGPSRTTVRGMSNGGAEGLEQLRAIVARTTGVDGQLAAHVLAGNGDPERDMPLLIDVLDRCRNSVHDKWGESAYEMSLARLSGLDLAEKSSVAAWREAWEQELARRQVAE